ncbi:MAG: TRAP transporter substrate-binding protein DctP [Treponema sp.]|jgi:TRAP-type C4-dicarboxylate transport system substrate-binding protein|nr:TRAP transporter substrate-binding protein DctP [Treponema sp.]
MKKIIISAILAAVLMFSAGVQSLYAQRGRAAQETIVVRLASPLPRESPWGRTLDRVAAEWSRVTGGQVRMNVLHGGTEGSEGRMHVSLASNTIQAAIFTTFGLSQINPSVMTMSAPFLIRSDEELEVVMREVQTDLEATINAGNYFMVAWSRSGFVNFFSRDPVFTPDDLRRLRIGSNIEAAEMNATFSAMGFQVIDTDWSDAGALLATGQITAMYQNPAGVAAFQLHSQMRHMLSMNLAPILGGIVINQVTWQRIGALNPRFQQELVRVTRQIAAEFDRDMQRTVDAAVASMVRDGLTVNNPTQAQMQLWLNEIYRVKPALLATTYDGVLYERINDILARHRSGVIALYE